MARESLTMVRESLYTVLEVTELDVAAEGGTTALDLVIGTEEEDFTFSENTENADGGTGALDLQDGITANWDAQAPKNIRVVGLVVINEGANIGTDPADKFSVQVFHNESPAFDSEEGQGDPDEAAVTYNLDGVLVGVKGGDTIRMVVVAAEGNIAADLDIASDLGSEFDLAAV